MVDGGISDRLIEAGLRDASDAEAAVDIDLPLLESLRSVCGFPVIIRLPGGFS